MTDKKITQLTELTTPALADVLPIVDDPAGVPETKKVTVEKILTTEAPTLTASGDIKAGGGLSVGSTVTDPATGDVVATGDVKAGSGMAVGSSTDSAGDGELWLVEKTALPTPTTDRNKLINYKNVPIFTSDYTTRRYRATSVDILTPFLQYPILRGVWYGVQADTGVYVVKDRLGTANLTTSGTIDASTSQYNGMFPVLAASSPSTGTNYLTHASAGLFTATNWFTAFGWFYVPSTGAVVKNLFQMGTTTMSWLVYVYGNQLTAGFVPAGGSYLGTTAVAIIPDAWNFCAYRFYWANSSVWSNMVYANGVWSTEVNPTAALTNPVGEFRVLEGSNNFKASAFAIGAGGASGDVQSLDFIYESTKAFYGH